MWTSIEEGEGRTRGWVWQTNRRLKANLSPSLNDFFFTRWIKPATRGAPSYSTRFNSTFDRSVLSVDSRRSPLDWRGPDRYNGFKRGMCPFTSKFRREGVKFMARREGECTKETLINYLGEEIERRRIACRNIRYWPGV